MRCPTSEGGHSHREDGTDGTNVTAQQAKLNSTTDQGV